MPAGECPECAASAMLDEGRREPSIHIVRTAKGEHATHFPSRTIADGLAGLMSAPRGASTYGVQHIEGHGFRIGAFRRSAYPQMVADSYVRINTS